MAEHALQVFVGKLGQKEVVDFEVALLADALADLQVLRVAGDKVADFRQELEHLQLAVESSSRDKLGGEGLEWISILV